jgi:hypothetical protein
VRHLAWRQVCNKHNTINLQIALFIRFCNHNLTSPS